MTKRNLGSAVRARRYWSQCREMILLALKHNLDIIQLVKEGVKSASKVVFSRRKLPMRVGFLSFLSFSYAFVDFFELFQISAKKAQKRQEKTKNMTIPSKKNTKLPKKAGQFSAFSLVWHYSKLYANVEIFKT